MHRTQIYLQDDLYENLKQRARRVGISMSELIRRQLARDIQKDPVADAKAYFAQLTPLESFSSTAPEEYVTELRSRSRILRTEGDAP